MSDIIDEIDALVDWQMQQESSGYDHNVNQAECRICGGTWHGLAITARMQKMRRRYLNAEMLTMFGDSPEFRAPLERVERELNEYRHADDDSEILCPGSEFIGPWVTRGQLSIIRVLRAQECRTAALNTQRFAGTLPVLIDESVARGEVFVVGSSGVLTSIGHSASVELTDGVVPRGYPSRLALSPIYDEAAALPRNVAAELNGMMSRFQENVRPMFGQFADVARHIGESLRVMHEALDEPDPEPQTPQQRALPQPSTTPPMWANDVTRSRRPRRNPVVAKLKSWRTA